jgi:hypothetical protein
MRTLKSTLSATITNPAHLAGIDKIDAEDFSSVRKKVKADALKVGKTISDEYLDRGILGLKQYYAVAMLDPANGHAVSPELDPLWHAHMLFSSQYDRFCKGLVGEYMHHSPLLHDDHVAVEKVARLYEYTIEVLRASFTDLDPVFWPLTLKRDQLLCAHQGTSDMYPDWQVHRLYPPNPEYAVRAA